MAFVVVEYSEESGGGVSLVNSKWLTPRKQEVWWPPYKHQHVFDKALRNGESPDETWTLYTICRRFYETDDLVKAREKLQQSQTQSDLQSEVDDEFVLRKRKRRPRKISFGSSDDDDAIDQLSEGSQTSSKKLVLPRPPKVQLLASKSLEETAATKGTANDPIIRTYPICEKTSEELITEQISPTYSSCFNDSGIHSHSRNSSHNTPTSSIRDSSPSSSFSNTQSAHSSDINKKVLTLMVYIKEQNSQIIKLLENFQKPSPVHPFELPENLPITFPVNSIEDIQKIERFLDSKENLHALASYFSTIGGRDVVSKTNTILKNIMTNALASQYSFLGTRKEKRAFSHLKLKAVVVRAVQITCPDCLESDVCNNIKTWLKHAPQRNMKEIKDRVTQQ